MSRVCHRACIGVLVLLVVLPAALPVRSPAEAQLPADPLILVIDGDLWSWIGPDQPLVQLTFWGMNDWPAISPDGTYVAYKSVARIFADWLKTIQRGTGGYAPPENIWILDVGTGETFRIADQTADAVWDGPVNPGRYVLRTSPSWSPDGHQLTWFELLIDTITFTGEEKVGTGQLVTYDLENQTKRVLDSFDISRSFSSSDVFDVEWGAPGIAFNIGSKSYSPTWEFRVYDPSGTVLSQFKAEEENALPWVFSGQWIEGQDQDYLFDDDDIFYHSVSGITGLNWRTGQYEPLTGAPELFSLSAPDGARFYVSGRTWYLALPGQAPLDLGEHVQSFGISRDGQWAVYTLWETDPATGYYADTVFVQSHDQLIEIGRYQNAQLVWGPVAWRIRPQQ